jgi:uncharacterized membrane protein
MNALGTLDWIGLALLVALWSGYSVWAARAQTHAPSLMTSLARYRRVWMREAYRRENKMTDVALTGSLMQSATFFSSTTLLILGGLFAVLGTVEKSAELVRSLPFATRTSQELLEMKALALTLVFVYAFFRFTWSMRQFNLVNILIGAFPAQREHQVADDRMIEQAARLNELAGRNFTHGLRSYYYAVPLMLWLINPWLLAIGAVVITGVTWYMEFRSPTVRALLAERE